MQEDDHKIIKKKTCFQKHVHFSLLNWMHTDKHFSPVYLISLSFISSVPHNFTQQHKYFCKVVNTTLQWRMYQCIHTALEIQSEHCQENIRRHVLLTAYVRHNLQYSCGSCTFSSDAWAKKETDDNPHCTRFSSSSSSYGMAAIFLIPVAGPWNASATISIISMRPAEFPMFN